MDLHPSQASFLNFVPQIAPNLSVQDLSMHVSHCRFVMRDEGVGLRGFLNDKRMRDLIAERAAHDETGRGSQEGAYDFHCLLFIV